MAGHFMTCSPSSINTSSSAHMLLYSNMCALLDVLMLEGLHVMKCPAMGRKLP